VVRFLVWTISTAFGPRVMLIAENLCLRQRLLVLRRRHPQPRLCSADRRFCSVVGMVRPSLSNPRRC
jgi:hypothetical protein